VIQADGPAAEAEPTDLVVREITLKKGDELVIEMAPGGGQAVRLTPAAP
jgi:hypothetical protein